MRQGMGDEAQRMEPFQSTHHLRDATKRKR